VKRRKTPRRAFRQIRAPATRKSLYQSSLFLANSFFRQGSFSEVRIAPVLVGYPSRPGHSGFSLRRAGVMAMLSWLRGRRSAFTCIRQLLTFSGPFFVYPSSTGAQRLAMLRGCGAESHAGWSIVFRPRFLRPENTQTSPASFRARSGARMAQDGRGPPSARRTRPKLWRTISYVLATPLDTLLG
jgi:hypothetical protein